MFSGYQGPGGPLVGENGELTNCTGGASGYIDRLFFTEAHIIPKPRCARIYHSTLSVDPEGILGTFNSIALCVFGLQVNKISLLHVAFYLFILLCSPHDNWLAVRPT